MFYAGSSFHDTVVISPPSVYDVTSRDSFENIDMWLSESETNCTNRQAVRLLVGNKIDMVRSVAVGPRRSDTLLLTPMRSREGWSRIKREQTMRDRRGWCSSRRVRKQRLECSRHSKSSFRRFVLLLALLCNTAVVTALVVFVALHWSPYRAAVIHY